MSTVIIGLLLLGPTQDARECYSAAAKLLREKDFVVSNRILNGQRNGLPSPLPRGLSADMPEMHVIRWQEKTLTKIFNLVEKGNQLAYPTRLPDDPYDKLWDIQSSEDHRQLVNAIINKARLSLVDHRTDDATRALLAADRYSYRNIDEGTLSYTIGISTQQKVLDVIQDNMSQFRRPDWDSFDKLAGIRLADRTLIGRVYLNNLKFMRSLIRQMPREYRRQAAEKSSGAAPKEIGDAMISPTYNKMLTEARWKSILKKVDVYYSQAAAEIQRINRLPEADWNFEIPALNVVEPKVVHNDQEMVRALVAMLRDVKIDQLVFRSRVQYRLLLLHARLRKYRFKYFRYPSKLFDVASKAECFDPLSRMPFVYQELPDGYRLVSAGRPGFLGEVSLANRPSSNRRKGPP